MQTAADEFVGDNGDDDVSVGCIDGAIDQRKIAVVDARLAHRLAGDAHQERRLRVANQDVVQIEAADAAIASRRAEADRNAGAGRGPARGGLLAGK